MWYGIPVDIDVDKFKVHYYQNTFTILEFSKFTVYVYQKKKIVKRAKF